MLWLFWTLLDPEMLGRPPRKPAADNTVGASGDSLASALQGSWINPRARAIAANSTTSIRRSPPSYLAVRDCRRPSRLATACRRPLAYIRRAYSADLRDFSLTASK